MPLLLVLPVTSPGTFPLTAFSSATLASLLSLQQARNDTVLDVLHSWSPLPGIMFSSITAGSFFLFYLIQVSSRTILFKMVASSPALHLSCFFFSLGLSSSDTMYFTYFITCVSPSTCKQAPGHFFSSVH